MELSDATTTENEAMSLCMYYDDPIKIHNFKHIYRNKPLNDGLQICGFYSKLPFTNHNPQIHQRVSRKITFLKV